MVKEQTGEIALLRAVLAEECRNTAKTRYLHRLHCVLLMLQGQTSARVAGWFLRDATTMARWLRMFERHGVAGLSENKRSGRPLALDLQKLAELRQALGRPPAEAGFTNARNWAGKLVATWLERRYGVSFSLRHCQRLLRDLCADAAGSEPQPRSNAGRGQSARRIRTLAGQSAAQLPDQEATVQRAR